MSFAAPLLADSVPVRNTDTGNVVFGHKPTDTNVEWAGKGDPDGNDVQEFPLALLGAPGMKRCINKGILVVVKDDAEAAVQHQVAASQAREQAQAQAIADTLDTSTEQPVAEVAIDTAGKVTDLKKAGQPVGLIATGEFDGEGKPILAEHAPIIDPPVTDAAALPPQGTL